ncbi:hypothetical protein [Paracidovorax wautersii]|nr:hypothetical protein [Paracidovorax wautersii]
MGLARGIADAMESGRANGAESVAAFAQADADHARRMLRDANRTADRQVGEWRALAGKLDSALKERNAQASAAFIVINGVLKAMETELTPELREQFRQKVVQVARARIVELDLKNKSDPERMSIAEAFKGHHANQTLGVV